MVSSPRAETQGNVLARRYVIQRKLGTGSLGTVYLAHDEETGRRVALKTLRTDRGYRRAIEDLRAEFRTIAGIEHPRIARAFDFGYLREDESAPGIPYYTREFVEGTPLPGGPPGEVAPAEYLRPILDLLEALEYLHASGLTHRDLHAGNLIVGDDPARGATLIDLGFMESPASGAGRASTTQTLGVPPAILRATEAGRASAAIDIFMAGRLLHYRLTGQTSGEIRLPPEIPGWGARRTLELERIATKAAPPDPERQFRSATEFRRALADALGEETPEVTTEPTGALVGRDLEIERIDRILNEFARGRSGVAWISGRPGGGRSRLLREMRLRTQLAGFATIDVTFVRGSGPQPALERALREAKSSPAPAREWLGALDVRHGGTRAERAERAARAYFSESGAPLVLLLDDFDIADNDSRALVLALAETIALERKSEEAPRRPICLGVVTSDDGTELPAEFLVPLRPLTKRAQAELFSSLLSPLTAPPKFVARVIDCTRGSPLRIRQVSAALRATWGPHGAIPAGAELPTFPGGDEAIDVPTAILENAESRAMLSALAIIDRPARRAEVMAAAQLDARSSRRAAAHLRSAELLIASRRGGTQSFRLSSRAIVEFALRSLDDGTARTMHARLASFLQREGRADARSAADRARHLIGAGRQREGAELALRAAEQLRHGGYFEAARSVLECALGGERSKKRRLTLVESLSRILEELGDHEDGIALVEPVFAAIERERAASGSRSEARGQRSRDAVRIRRLLGVHYHRAGRTSDALRVFEEAAAYARPSRDVEDLVFVDSELAELYTYRGEYGSAEEACTRGLERLGGLQTTPFRQRMEVILRATQGHLELRRLNLGPARDSLNAALTIAGTHGTPALEAVILNNLGIVERQSNRFGVAVRCFRRAERLLTRAREGRSVIKIACNLALIAAHRGDRDEARSQLARALELLRLHPGQRLEFFVGYTEGIVAQLTGDSRAAIPALEAALALGRSLGDAHLVSFGEVALAEALLFSGRYTEAKARLGRARRIKSGRGGALLERMIAARRYLLDSLLGADRARARSRALLLSVERTDAELPETWNDLFVALGERTGGAGDDASLAPPIHAIAQRFRTLKIPAGVALASSVALLDDAARTNARTGRRASRRSESPARTSHDVAAVAEPLAAAAAQFRRGSDSARELLQCAADAIVGRPFLELDLWIEVLRGHLAFRDGDLGGARRHLHRARHTHEVLTRFVPARSREAFERLRRFDLLRDLDARVRRVPAVVPSTRRAVGAGEYHGMVGRSEPMAEVFRWIERLRDQVVPVLIRGETGTGKELAARAIHASSPHRGGSFLALHCGSIPDELFEAELCGYEAGAFTGAETASPGLLEELCDGTILLDDVDALSPGAQAKLLRIIDAKSIRRLGGVELRPLEVRILASTSGDLEAAIDRETFRRDLYHRLRVVELELPPLRHRRGDIADLARHFLARHSARMDRPNPSLDEECAAVLREHAWPGNVRELETIIVRALVVQTPGRSLRPEVFSALIGESRAAVHGENESSRERFVRSAIRAGRSLKDLRRDLEASYVTELFRELDGDVERMMETLGVKKTQLYDLFRRTGVDVKSLREES